MHYMGEHCLISCGFLQDDSIHTEKVLALASLCIPLGACITAVVCSTTLWSMEMKAADAHVHAAAVVMQGKVCLLPSRCQHTSLS